LKEVCKWLCCRLMKKTGQVVTTIYKQGAWREDALTFCLKIGCLEGVGAASRGQRTKKMK